jgi:hypothetical protein
VIERQWLRDRGECRNADSIKDCVKKAYETRIKELRSLPGPDSAVLTPPNRSESSPEARPKKSRPPAAKPLAEVNQPNTERRHESTLEQPRKPGPGLPVNEQLRLAAGNGSMEQVKNLLEKGADPNAVDEYRNTLLMYAAGSGNPEVVKFLVDKGLDVNAKSKIGSTALMDAARTTNIEIAKTLIDKGADVNAKGNSGGTALTVAAYNGRLALVQLLLDKGADVNAKEGVGDETPLMWAVESSKGEGAKIVQLLLEKGADVNAVNKRGGTALMAVADRLDVAKILIDKGAQVNAADKNGRTPLMGASYWDISKSQNCSSIGEPR